MNTLLKLCLSFVPFSDRIMLSSFVLKDWKKTMKTCGKDYVKLSVICAAILTISFALSACTSTQGSARYAAPTVHIEGQTVTITHSPIVRDTITAAAKDYDMNGRVNADVNAAGSPEMGDSGVTDASTEIIEKGGANGEEKSEETQAPVRGETGETGRKSDGEKAEKIPEKVETENVEE